MTGAKSCEVVLSECGFLELASFRRICGNHCLLLQRCRIGV